MIQPAKRTTAQRLLRRKVTEAKALAVSGELIEERERYRFWRFEDGSVLAIPKRNP